VPRSRSILLIAHATPPLTMSAARRAAGMTKHLSNLGHRVTVLTSVMCGSGAVPGAALTVRTRDLHVSPLNWRRSTFAALKGESEGAYSGAPSTLAAWVIPDLELVGWVPFLLPRAFALARSERFDCVITSSPPQSVHLVGRSLQIRGLPWLADLRDGWGFEPSGERFPPGLRHALDERLERAVLEHADAVTAVTPPIAEDLRLRVNPRAVTITNGYDPEELVTADGAAKTAPVAPERFTLAYTGTLAYGGASPGPLLDALRRLRQRDPEAMARLELVFAGPTSSAEAAELHAPDLRDSVRVLGHLPRTDALGLQRAADALLLVIDPRRPSIATGKLYEYLSARRPILVLGEGSVAARIVAEAGAGLVAPVDDSEAIADALLRLLHVGDGLPAPKRDAVERFSYAQLAAQLAEQVERAITARGERLYPRPVQLRSSRRVSAG
jgi:glycosyltransferase involved in cell wall biosynthesis